MLDHMGDPKITRAQESARHTYRRALETALRIRAKGGFWRSGQGSIYRQKAGWFVSATPSVRIREHVTTVLIGVKPMAIDPIYWDLVGLPEHGELPLSTRLNEAWSCRSPCFAELTLDEHSDAAIVAGRLLETADEQLDLVQRFYTVDLFLAACQSAAEKNSDYLPSVVATLIALGRKAEALSACENARAAGRGGGLGGSKSGFSAMACAWLREEG